LRSDGSNQWGFFNIRDGGSVSYIRTGGLIVDSDTASKWKRNANLNGAIAINKGGEVTVMKDAGNQWFDSQTGFADVLVTGPLLIEKGIPAPLPPTSLVTTRHPRSALGKSGRHKVILITVDGRTRESAGLSLNELTELMLSLKCSDALNLDGGGSTTLWISGMPFNGVVNMPCDNRKFDHEGARAVSSILVVR
jgi:exopolysaccharide biosynthesis protein